MNNKRISMLVALVITFAFIASPRMQAQDGGTLTMRQAISMALQNSRDLTLARVQYRVAANAAGVDRAAFMPNLYTGSGAAYTYGFPSIGGGPPAIFQLNYQQDIFNPLLKAQQRSAEQHAKSMKIEIDRTRDDVIVRTATAYLELAKVRHSLELMRVEQVSAEKIARVTRDRVAANQELSIEETRSELTAARVAERIIKLEGRDAVLTEQLRDLTGVPDSQSIEVETTAEPSFATDAQANELANMALQSDRGIQEAQNDREAQQQILLGAKRSYWPTLSVVGQYSVLSKFNNYDKYYLGFQENNLSVGVQINIPIFSERTRANVALAKSQLEESEVTLGNKRQGVRLDLLQKERSVRELNASREVARLDLKLAQETLQLSQAKFEQGTLTLRDIEQSRLDESDKWVAFLDADFALQQGQLSLLQATGQLAKVFQ
ncbi:MAG: TolC family protein [Candidatus Acidiferrales bacterium]